MMTLQQRFAELRFELPDLPANRALRDVQQLRGAGEAARAASHFEGF
jgi:hypothetical protein